MVYGDSGYIGIEKREEIVNDKHLSGIDYRINRRPGKGGARAWKDNPGQTWERVIGYRQ